MARARPDSAGLAVTVLLIAAVTLMPAAVHGRPEIDLCLVCGSIGVATGMLNILLFVPFGFFARLRTGAAWRAVAAGLCLSFVIEASQLLVPGRETALSDLLANTIGAAVGAALALRPAAWLLPATRRSRIAALGATVLVALAIGAAGALLDPSAPEGDYYGQWRPRGRAHPTHRGDVISVTLGDLPLPSQRLEDPAGVRRRLLGGDEIRLRYRASDPTTVVVPVFRLVFGPYGEGEDAVWIGAVDTTLVVWSRLRADDFHLTRPSLLLPGALAGVRAGDTVEVRVRRRKGDGFSVAVDDQPPHTIGFTVGRSWTLIYDVPIRSPFLLALVDHLWFVGLALVIGWYVTGWRSSAIAFGVVTAAALWAPRGSDLIVTPWTLPAMVATGLVAGARARAAFVHAFNAWTASTSPDGDRGGTATTRRRSPHLH